MVITKMQFRIKQYYCGNKTYKSNTATAACNKNHRNTIYMKNNHFKKRIISLKAIDLSRKKPWY